MRATLNSVYPGPYGSPEGTLMTYDSYQQYSTCGSSISSRSNSSSSSRRRSKCSQNNAGVKGPRDFDVIRSWHDHGPLQWLRRLLHTWQNRPPQTYCFCCFNIVGGSIFASRGKVPKVIYVLDLHVFAVARRNKVRGKCYKRIESAILIMFVWACCFAWFRRRRGRLYLNQRFLLSVRFGWFCGPPRVWSSPPRRRSFL